MAGDSSTQTGRRPAVARLTTGGSLDPTFDPAGDDGDGKKLLIGADTRNPWKSLDSPLGQSAR